MTKLGTSTYGSTTQPIYWNAGVPAAMSGALSMTYGGTARTDGGVPYVRSQGRLTAEASSSTAGSSETECPYQGIACFDTYSDSNTPNSYGNVLQIRGSANTGAGELMLGWMGSDSTTGYVYYRSHRDTTTGGWGAWTSICSTADTSSVGGSKQPVYAAANGRISTCNNMMSLTGDTFTGVAYAQTNTSYTTYQLRNIAFTTSTPSSLTNGYICMVYS